MYNCSALTKLCCVRNEKGRGMHLGKSSIHSRTLIDCYVNKTKRFCARQPYCLTVMCNFVDHIFVLLLYRLMNVMYFRYQRQRSQPIRKTIDCNNGKYGRFRHVHLLGYLRLHAHYLSRPVLTPKY